MYKETLEQKIKRVIAESVDIVPHKPEWLELFEIEKVHMLACFPEDFILRIEHFGSTSVPGLMAKPIIDMLIEISDEERGRELIPNVLEAQGYDCFWRPIGNENVPPYFTWCIKRDETGQRSHHLHFVNRGFKDKDLKFRDILQKNSDIAHQYAELKVHLAAEYKNDRVAYTAAKGEFIRKVLDMPYSSHLRLVC